MDMNETTRPLNIVLLAAGEIGSHALARALECPAVKVAAVFTYRVEPPQDIFLDRIRDACAQRGIPVHEASQVGRPELMPVWRDLAPDLILGMKWRVMVPSEVIACSRLGLVIFHASLLPRYRGFAPVNWALLNGETETGVTMFYAVDEVDAGDIIDQERIPLSVDDDAGTLEHKVALATGDLLARNLPLIAAGTARRSPQDHAQATYAIWRDPEDGRIDWAWPTRRIHDLVRALTSPYPGAFTTLAGRRLTVWKACRPASARPYVGSVPGKVERIQPGSGVNVLTGDGILTLLEVQLDGEGRQPAWEVLTRLKTHLGR